MNRSDNEITVRGRKFYSNYDSLSIDEAFIAGYKMSREEESLIQLKIGESVPKDLPLTMNRSGITGDFVYE